MMNFKNIFFITIILLAIFSISAISAEEIADDNGVDIISSDLDSADIVSTDISSDVSLIQENGTDTDDDGNSTQSSIVSSDLVKYYKNDTQYEATFFDASGNPLANKTIPIEINGVKYNRTTDVNGLMRMSINLNPGGYVIKVTNPATNEFALNNITVLPTLIGNDVRKSFKNATQYYLMVLDGQGKALPNADITFNINGVMYERKSNEYGIARLNINLNPGNYVISAYKGNGEVTSNNITVLPTITAKDVKKYYRNGTQYYANFTDSKGNPLANATVSFNINGVFYNRTTNENGTARLNINLNPGKYIITATNPVTTEQKGNTVEVLNKIVVKNSQTGGNISMEYNTKAKYTVVLYNDDGTIAKNKNVTFNINGVFYTRTSDENGTAYLTINLIPGNYVITSNFEGCLASNLIKVRISPTISVVSTKVKYGQPLQFYIKEKNSGNPITGEHYGVVLFNNTYYGALPDANGLVSIGQNLPVGFRDLFYFAVMDDNYYSSIMMANTIEIVE